jgi:hypothetical protein
MVIFLSFLGGILFASTIFFLYRISLVGQIESLQNKSVLDDLEIATKEQLLKEFRSRPNNSYILLMPLNKKDEAGMNIELNSFSPYDSVSLLHLATCLIFRDMKNRGMSVPDLPPIDEYDDQL